MLVGKDRRDGVCEVFRHGQPLRVSAISVPSGKRGRDAQILVSTKAIPAGSATLPEPGYANPVAGPEPFTAFPRFEDGADRFVAGDHVGAPWHEVALGQVKISPAYPAHMDSDQQLSRCRYWIRTLTPYKWH
ncbi:hypothetical protein GCM10023063_13630 [Arthrobacter methylotrophus]